MFLPRNRNDIISKVAEETGYSKELVRFVIKDFEAQLRKFIASPFTTGKKIVLRGLGSFKFREYKLPYIIEGIEYSTKNKPQLKNDLDKLKQLDKYYERKRQAKT